MDDSLIAVCKTCDLTKNRLMSVQQTNEVIVQENHELKMKNEVLERVNSDLESEVTYLNNAKSTEERKVQDLQVNLDSANFKIKTLEAKLEEEKLQSQSLMKEAKENKEKQFESNIVVRPDQDQIDLLSTQLLNLEIKLEEDQQSINILLEEKSSFEQTIKQMKIENQTLQCELVEVKEHLNQKVIEIRQLNENIESVREEKMLLGTELQILKASDNNASRGNSLFAEVEENRLKVAARHQVLKLKYLDLKKILGRSQADNNKLKLEIIRMKKEEKDDENTIHQDYENLIQTYKERLSELEDQMKTLQLQATQNLKIASSEGDSQSQWVNAIVDNARKDAQALQAELERRGSYYVIQGHQLFDSQKENRKLKTMIKKLESEIDELKLKLNAIEAAKENVDDGISPPADDIALQCQRKKIVKFKEVIQEHKSFNEENTDRFEDNKQNV